MSGDERSGNAPDVQGLPVGGLPEHDTPPTVDLPVPSVALAVGAHPDDIEFGCGATLAKWAAAGCRIHHLVLTDGSKGTWDESTDIEELKRVRVQEQRAAAKVLGGGDVTFLGMVDGELDSGMQARRAVCEVIRRVRPDVLLGHDPWRRYRLHPDHRHAGWLVTDGLVAARDHTFFPETGAAHRPSSLLLFEADVPNHVENVSGHLSTKIEALMAHHSQHVSTMRIGRQENRGQGISGRISAQELATEASVFSERVMAQSSAHGALAGIEAGEAFHLIDRT